MLYLFGIDQSFVMQTGVAIRSLDRFLSKDDTIMVFHLGLGSDDVEKITACTEHARIDFLDCSGMLEPEWIPPPYLSSAAYLRNLAPKVFEDESVCVYLDGDVLVRRSPSMLASIDVSNSTMAAVRSRVASWAASPGGIRSWFELGIPGTAPTFNSGVLVMNLERMRRRQTILLATEFLRNFGSEAWIPDQEALNVAVVGEWLQLDRTWNYITHVSDSFLQQPELEPEDPHIVHFAGRNKPWSYDHKPLFSEEWYQLLELTPWRGFRPVAPKVKKGARAIVAKTILRFARKMRTWAR